MFDLGFLPEVIYTIAILGLALAMYVMLTDNR